MDRKVIYIVPTVNVRNTALRATLLVGSNNTTATNGKSEDFDYGVRERNNVGVD